MDSSSDSETDAAEETEKITKNKGVGKKSGASTEAAKDGKETEAREAVITPRKYGTLSSPFRMRAEAGVAELVNHTNRMRLGQLNEGQTAELRKIDDEMLGRKDQAEMTDEEKQAEERLLNDDPEN